MNCDRLQNAVSSVLKAAKTLIMICLIHFCERKIQRQHQVEKKKLVCKDLRRSTFPNIKTQEALKGEGKQD